MYDNHLFFVHWRGTSETIEALAAAKARGVVLGSYSAVLAEKNATAAAARDAALAPVLAELDELSANAIAAELNRRKIASPRGGTWSATTIIRAQRRLASTKQK